MEAYDKGIEEEREGDESGALADFDRAVKLDDELSAAHLRIALRGAFLEGQGARAHFSAAMKHRGRLSSRDRELLDAAQPLFQREPPDMDEWKRRLELLGERYPGDAELAYEVGAMSGVLGSTAKEAEFCARAVRLDPKFGLAWSALAEGQAYQGQFDAARETVNRCLEALPSASECRFVIEFVDDQQGRCEDHVINARRQIATSPDSPDGYKSLVYALGSLNKSRESIREAIDQTVQRTTDPFGKKRLFLNLMVRLETLFGDFTAALAHAEELRVHVATRPDVGDHAAAAYQQANLLHEVGRDDRAGQIAKEFLDRKEAWAVEPIAHDYALANDPTPTLASMAYHAKLTSKGDYEALLAEWRNRFDGRLHGDYRPYLWVYGYSTVLAGSEDVADAMAALPRYLPLPAFIPNGDLPFATIGRTLWLGGQEELGTSYLQRATVHCNHIPRPLMWIKSHAWLAEALAKKGDSAGACKRLDVVLSHWGSAKPRSLTAEAALAKSRALGCSR